MTSATADQFSGSFAAAFSSGKLDRVLSHYCPDAVLMDRDGTEHRGHDAIARVYRSLLSLGLRMQVKSRFAVETGEIAMLRNDFEVFKGQDVQFKGSSIAVLRRDHEGAWRLLLDQPYA